MLLGAGKDTIDFSKYRYDKYSQTGSIAIYSCTVYKSA